MTYAAKQERIREAAPDMLKALEGCCSAIYHALKQDELAVLPGDYLTDLRDGLSKGRGAIAKVKGE